MVMDGMFVEGLEDMTHQLIELIDAFPITISFCSFNTLIILHHYLPKICLKKSQKSQPTHMHFTISLGNQFRNHHFGTFSK